ncbi:protein piccolo isoform X2 [Electrophorus electricus]|uniref:protein piccolo isoform X2 n=1 Tax=Electrophorus electricus TaxID=8005 RepID=UPI0015D0A294|nr:protein piccolo isoform X2 [Electrophorus electricus]
MPHQTELIEWLCLNCQTQRAVGHSPVLPKKASVQPHHSGKSDFSTPQKASPKATPPQKDKKAKDIQKLQDQQAKASNGTPPVHKPQQQETEKPQVDASKIKDDSGFFGFGFGGARARSPSPQPAMSAVSEKVLGFGSSFLSSASNLISAAVQDDASTTPPTSRKGSSVSHIPHKTESAATTPVTSHKAFEPSHDVMETSHPPKSPAQAKRGQEVIKPGTVGRSSQHLPQTCLLCKTEIKKDLSNYSTCTECKNTVCNLCGFNPMPHQTKIQEWLCLSCHTQRASDTSSVLSQSQANKISTNSSSQKMDGAVSEHPQKEKDIPDETIQKGQTAHAVKQPEDTSIPAGEKQVTVTPTANEITQQQPRLQEDTEKSQNQTSKTFKDETPQENSGFFGIGGVCTQSQSPQPAASAVAGNVLDFGSSFLSSASNLISSTVLDEPSTTPPSTQKSSLVSQSCTEITTPPHSSRKGSAVPQKSEVSENSEKRQTEKIKPQGEQNKKETIQEEKDTKIHQGKGPFKPEPLKEKESPHALPKDCPLCKVEIKKDPANYSTCTECKTIVCLCCGFNPTPHKTEAKEWVCLNCQMQRAPDPSPVEHQPQDNKLHPPSSPKQKKDTTTKDKDKKALANEKPEGKKDDPEKKQPLGSPATKQATQKEHPKEELPEKDQQTKNETSEPSKSAHSKEETGFLGFSFGTRSRPTSPQPAVAGKVLGFGSSILSSASNLLSSAVQDGPFTTPPPSRKGSTVSQTSDKSLSTPPMSRKGSEVSHISTTTPLTTQKASAQDSPKMNPINVTKPPTEQNQEKTLQEKKPDDEKLRAPSLSILMDITESDTTKGTEPIQPLSKVCPLCKMELRKDPPNYNICIECKNTVCDLCGFNPMPDHTEVKQWLCLQCQMLRASGPPQLTQPQPIKVPPPVAPQEEGQGQCSVQSPSQLQDLKSPLQQGSEEDTSPPKPIVSQTEPHKDKSAFFGSSQPAVSAVSVKVLGFSSSIISSASNLISSAVQDESSRTAPTSETSVTFPTPATSHKGAAISDASEKVPSNVDAISTQQLQEKKARRKTSEIQSINEPSAQERKDESLSEPLKACPLCTVKFKTDPPNFNTCTFCKSTVCNLCGFNPVPQQSEVKEWLCLNCQIQRVPGPPPVQPQANKAPPPASPQKKETSAPDALQKESNPQTVATYKDQKLSLPAKVEDPLSAKSQEPTSISTSQPSPAKSPPPQKAEPPKKESSFFGFGGPRSQSPSSQPSVSAVPGKVLGFGSSIFSSASNLITSVVQNEPSTTPPTSRKGSTVSQTAVKPESTPPASRKESVLQIPPKPASSAKTNAPDIQKQEENKPANDAPNAQSTKAPSAPVKEDENLSKHPNLCPLCKDKFNEDPPNYNTCSFCKATVCNMCGFNTMPHQTEVKEWLCLNCQMQRAPGSPPSGQLQQMAMKEPPTEMEVSNPDPTQKKTGSAKELNQKPAKPGKPQEELTSVEIQKPSTTLEGKQHSVSAPHTEEQSAVSGKALGFSSSFFSSASNLISSAVQDKSSATPPTTHKDYTFTQSSIKNSPTPPSSHKGSVAHKEEGKNSEVKSEDQLAKTQVSLMEQEPSLLDPPRDCPLCKADLKKDPPNYNSCTQCKKIVCNLCGFSPIPQQSEVKEWLCLNCQVQRVPDPPPAKLQSHTNKAPPSASPTQKRPSPDPSTSQESSSLSDAKVKNDLLHATGKPEDKPVSAESLKSTPVPSTQPPPSAKPTLPQKAETSKEESGFFGFHLGAARSRPASPQPAVSAVSGKVFGFGSSFLSSASSLISSAVQGESSTTPPTSRKASTVSQTSAENTPTPPTARKGSVLQKQEEKRGLEVKLEDQLSNAPITSVKKEAPLSAPISICPICKGDLKKDQPNYNTCTECKNTVCNLCGFTPVPQHSEVKEWLCLNCQVQRAPDSPPSQFQSHTNKAPPSAPPTQKRETSLVGAPEEKTSLPKDATAKDQKSHMTVKPEDETVSVASQKSTPVPTQQPPLAKSALPQKVERSKNNSGFFGFARSRSPSPQPVVSAVSGKVRGFGSSFLSSASSLISSAVQDDPATTPPTSRKGSVISQTSSKDIPILSTDSKGSVVQIKEEKKKTEITTEDQSKVSPSLVKKDAPLLESPKACPLCKAELKDNPPNYNTCTECKNTVCNLCGFHPMPHETEVEWLCLNCQIKRAPGAKQTTQQAEEGPCPTLPQLAGEPEVGEPEDKPAEEIHTKKPTPPQSPTAESASLPKVEPYKEESGSFGGTHSQPPSSQSADSAISTFVKTTPIPPISQKENLKCVGPEIIPQGEETKTSAEKTKLDEKPFPTDMVADESPSNAAPSKAQHVACPLCMMELNVGLDKATNYKTCTECKNTVCNNCGFNPIPHQTEANEWLCLNCQTQRALKGLEPKGSPVTQPDIVSTSAQQTRTITPISATDACEITETDTVQVKETEVEVSEVEDKTSQKEETHVAWAVEHGPGQIKQFSEELPIMEDQKAAIPQKTVTEQSVSGVMSAMQDEPSITSPHSRKGSTVSQASIKTDTPPTSQKASVKTPPISRKGSTASQASLKMPSTADTKPSVKPDEKSDEESTPSETAKLSEPLQPVPRSRQSNCPICKVDLNIGSEDSPNFNTCTECKNNACVQCGMDTMPYQTKVKKWLCLNCKIQQKIEMEPSGTPIPKPLPTSLEKESQSLPSVPMLAEPKASDPSTCVDEKNIHIPAILKKDVPAINPQQETSAGIKQSDMNPQNKEPQQETNPESAKSQPELTKRTDLLAKSGPPPQSKGPKQDSGFTGLVFGGGKSQPSPPKISDSTSRKLFGLGELAETARSRSPSPKTVTNVSGRFLGFGTSIISSASNLISSAVQDERAASPPTSRKGSTASQSSVKCSTPPPSQNVSKMPPAEPKAPDSKKLNEKKIEEKEIGEPGLAKLLPANAKQEAWPDPAELSATAKAKTNQLLCPLCKVALNVETNDPPNYNTCTQCKNVVCCLCGFNPMPHLSEVEWLCLNCQTQRALQQQMRDTGQNSTSSVRSIEPDPKAQAIKTSVPSQAIEATPGLIISKNESNQQAVTVSSLSVGSAHAAGGPVHTADVPPDKTVDKKPEWKCEIPQPAVKEEKKTEQPAKCDDSSHKSECDDSSQSVMIPPTTTMDTPQEALRTTGVLVEAQHDVKEIYVAPTVATKEVEKVLLNKEVLMQTESTRSTPSELENTLLGAEAHTLKVDEKKDRPGRISPESYSSAEEELKAIQIAGESFIKLVEPNLAVSIKDDLSTKENSSESEQLPFLQRIRSAESSYSEDYKPVSPDFGDEEFIQTQLMEMCMAEGLSPSFEEKNIKELIGENNQQKQYVTRDAAIASPVKVPKITHQTLSVEVEDSSDNIPLCQNKETEIMQVIHTLDTSEKNTVNISVLNDNEKTEVTDLMSIAVISSQPQFPASQIIENNSLTESTKHRSKGDESSSIQAPHITPLASPPSDTASPTSLSSLEKESDSSPSQRLDHQLNNLLPVDDICQSEDLWQTSRMKVYESSSFSDISPSIEPESENFLTYQLPPICSSIDAVNDAVEKTLKSAEEIYEEMMQKAEPLKAMTKKVTPPEIEPLYGGMLIEDYAYESLVEEPAMATAAGCSISENVYLSEVIVQEEARKLTTPEEAYVEMQKKRELMLKGKLSEHVQVEKEIARSDFAVPAVTDTCYVTVRENDKYPVYKDEESGLHAEDVLTPKTSPTRSSPLSPISPFSSSEPLYDSPEVVLTLSSGEEDNTKDEYASEHVQYAMEPYIDGSTSPEASLVKKALYPIPDLKITQCSSGEEEAEDEDKTQEYKIAMSNDQSDDNSKEAAKIIMPSSQSNSIEDEPTFRYEIPLSKHVREDVSPIVPPLSPQTLSPDSTTSASSTLLTDQIPESGSISRTPTAARSSTALGADSASFIIVMPAPQVAVVTGPPGKSSFQEISLSQAATSTQQITSTVKCPIPPEVSFSKPPLAPKPPHILDYSSLVSTYTSSTVSINEQNRISFPSHAGIPASLSAAGSVLPAYITASTSISSAQASVPCFTPVPFVQMSDAMSTASECLIHVPSLESLKTPDSTTGDMPSPAFFKVPPPAPVIVQMSDLVASSSQSPVHIANEMLIPAYSSVPATTVSPATDRKSIAPTTVSIPIHYFSPDAEKLSAATATVQALPVTSPAVTDTDGILKSESQILSPDGQTKQGRFVIILPKNTSVINQTTQDIVTNSGMVATSVDETRIQPFVVSVSPVVSTDVAPMEPQVTSVFHERANIPVIEFPPPPVALPSAILADNLPYPAVNQESVPTPSCVRASSPEFFTSMTIAAQSEAVNLSLTAINKSPPPVPPKPVCIPSGLVFSHRSRESIKPPNIAEHALSQTGHAATLPRTKKPPNALSLSLNAPVDSKHNISSPKSPLSPRFSKTLETYVVITLPSEPGSPIESITTQAPVRRSSLPTSAIAPRLFIPPALSEPLVSTQVVAASPKVVLAPAMLTQTAVVPVQTVGTPPVPETAVQTSSTFISVPVIAMPSEVAPASSASALTFVPQTGTFGPPIIDKMTNYAAPSMVTAYGAKRVFSSPLATAGSTILSAPVSATLQIPAPATMVSDSVELDRQHIQTVCPAPITDHRTIQAIKLGPSTAPVQQHPAFFELQQEAPVVYAKTVMPASALTFAQFTNPPESQELRRPDKVVANMSQMYSAISAEQHPESLPNVVTQMFKTEVQRTTTLSVVQERIPLEPVSDPGSVEIILGPEITKTQIMSKQNGKPHYSGDIIDLTTLKVNVTMTDMGMDLTAPKTSRESLSIDSSGRQATAIKPEIVNLTAEIPPPTTLSVVTDSISIVTCSATIAFNNNIVDKPLNLRSATSKTLPLTTYKRFEPLAQIVYRPVNSQPKPTTSTEIPVNLSCGTTEATAPPSLPSTLLVTVAPVTCINARAGVPIHIEPSLAGAIDLTTSRPKKDMVALSSSSGVVTAVVEDMAPVDLTAGKRTVCCDVLYRLPFTGSCRTQPPATTQPGNQLGSRDDHSKYDNATTLGTEKLSKMKASVSNSNFTEIGLFTEGKNEFAYQNGTSEAAIDLTSGKVPADEALDFSKKGTLTFSGITTMQYSQTTSSGVNSVLRSSNGVVYSSVAAPVPSTYAITTQPASIFCTSYNSPSSITDPFSALQNQTLPYDFTHDTGTNQSIFIEPDPSKDTLPSVLANLLPSLTAFPELYSDATLEAIAASLDTLVSPNYPTTDDTKSQLYQAEREFLQLEKLKQLCLAEELEWERHEIQRYREQEQIIVQKELEELQSMKQKLLMQQEEERKAHLMLQQETFAQQQLQLEQIHQLQKKLQQQLQEQKMYSYGIETNEGVLQPTTSGILDPQYTIGDNGQYWPVKDDNSILSVVTSHDPVIGQDRHTASSSLPESEAILKDTVDQKQNFKKLPSTAKHISEQNVDLSCKKIAEGNVKTDEEDGVERPYSGRKRRSRRSVDSCVQTDDEDQDEWDVPVRSRRRSRSRYADGERGKGSKVSSIAIQTVAEISVQTDHSGTINRSPVRAQVDTTVDLHKGGQPESDSDVTSEKDKKQSTPVEIGVSTQLKADGIGVTLVHKSPNVLYSPVSPVSPGKGTLKILSAEPSRHPTSPRSLKGSQRSLGSLSDPKSLSPTTDDRIMYQYSDAYSSKGSQNGTTVGSQKKVKRTLPHPPPEDDTIAGPSGYSTGSARRRMCRTTTLARAKILQDIDKELDLVERESSKLRKKQAELDEEEKEIDAKLRYLEMGINRRKEALLKEREKRERAYLQGVAEERDYMSDSEVSNIRGAQGNGHGLERPRTAPQSEFNQFIPPQTEADSQYAHLESPYSHYQYASQTGTTNHYSQQTLYQQQSLYHQQTSPYQTQSVYSSVPTLNQQSQQTGYDHASQLLLMQQKNCQTTLSELETKINTNYEVIRNQPLLIVPTSTDYGVSHLGGKYSNLELRMGLEERGSMASSPMSSISAESFYADIDHHNARNYVMIDDIGELTKSSPGLGSSFNIPDKDMSKTDRLLRAAEVRRTADVADFLGPLQAASRLHSYGKPEEDSMEEPYELKLLKQQIKQEFRRGTDGLEQLTGLPHYLHSDSFRHFPKSEKYSIGRLTLEKQAAKQLPASVLYQKQLKNKRALIDPKITKFSPIQETRDLEPDYSSFLASTGSAMGGLSSRARLLQDEITFGLRKNIAEQQKYLGSSLSTNLAQSLNLGQSLNLSQSLRTSLQEDGTYPSVTRSRSSSRPSSAYGLDLSIKRDLSSSSLRLKAEGEGMDSQFGAARAKPTSLPISQSRGRIPIVAQNSEEESPLSPVGQPMGMARASAGPLPPISADSRDQFGSSHSLPEVQQHMREESRTRGYDRDIAFIMDDLQGAMSDSEASAPSWKVEAYHLQHEETDWFDKPREEREGQDRRRIKAIHYPFPHTRIKLQKDPKDHTVSGSGFGIRVVGGKEIPGTNGEIGAYIAKVLPGGTAEHTGKIVEGMQVLEWSGIPLIAKTYEEVQSIVGQQNGEAEICVRLDLNMLSDSEHHQQLELHPQFKTSERQRSPGVDPKQLAAELQKVSQQQAPASVLAVLEKAGHLHSATTSDASSGVPSPGQPGSPSVNKKRHSSKSAEALKQQPHPISGEIQLQINYDKNMGNLIVHVLQARNLSPRDNNGYSDPFVKVYLLPGRGQVMVVQNASAENKRRTKYVQKTQNPEWNQTVIYKNIHLEQLKRKTLEVTVWDYDRYSSNDFLGEVLIDLSNTAQLDNMPRWHPLKEQSESIHHGRGLAPQGGAGAGSQGGQGGSGGSAGPGGTAGQPSNDQSPKTSVIKSRSHGIFPDPAKDTQVPTIEKSHSSPGSSKSSSEGHLRSRGPSRSQSKSSVTQTHLEEAGNAIAAAEAAVQQGRLQPNRATHRLSNGDGYTLDSEDGTDTNAVDSAIFQVPQLKAIPNGLDKRGSDSLLNLPDSEVKNQIMGEIKVALKKEMKTEGEQLVLEILQCRNITYKFKSPDHLPDLYVKLYVVNVATQKRIIKKKTRVCRHDREPSFNETFRFSLNPTGHSIQLFLVSNGGKFVKKTLIGEAYIWLDKVDMRKRAVSWHELVASSPHTQP